MLAVTSRYEDTPIIDFINEVQARTVEQALAGTEYADLPVLSQASPFSRTARFEQGPVTVADMAALYIYENTLLGVRLSGAEVKAYLEHSARYFAQVAPGASFDPETGTNAATPDSPDGLPDYLYDVLSGVSYTIDVSQPVGSRIVGLAHPDGAPVADDDEFVMAINNYRQSGGGGFPAVTGADRVVYDERMEIRQLMIDYATQVGTIDPADFFVPSWQLVTEPVVVTPDPAPAPAPTTEPAPGGGAAAGGTGTSGGSTVPAGTSAGTSGASTPSSSTPTAGSSAARSGALASTGADVAAVAGLAALLLAVGLGLWVTSRRRAAAVGRGDA
jgi:2',3'-cyclic-nucleotide 2'-phosphodiesterase/3'-nucleotidase